MSALRTACSKSVATESVGRSAAINSAFFVVRFQTVNWAFGKAALYASCSERPTVPAPTIKMLRLSGRARRRAAVMLSPAVFHLVTR